jgi:hypothetical protein
VLLDSVMWRRVMFHNPWARGRVGRVDVVFDVVPRAFVLVVFFLFFFVVVGFFGGGVLVVADRENLNASRVPSVALVVVESARVVVDSDSFPESDGNVSVALDVNAAVGRKRNTRRRCAARSARRRRRNSARLDRAVRKRPSRRSSGHCATMGEMGYD